MLLLLITYFLLIFSLSVNAEVSKLHEPQATKAPELPQAPQQPQAPVQPESGMVDKEAVASKGAKKELLAVSSLSTPKFIFQEDESSHPRWNAIHFKPAIDQATNQQCLVCHADVLERNVLKTSPAGVKSSEALAWYQTLETYEGEQQTFHQRHLTSKTAKELMDLKCSTCHQGHDPGVEISYLTQSEQVKQPINTLVETNICLMCHGKFDSTTMPGVAGDWVQVRDTFGGSCMVCHTIFRTKRHQVNYLNPVAIEKAGHSNSDSCYGCHGGRSWYSVAYSYPRHKWLGMGLAVPDWAKNRPLVSKPRFLKDFNPDKESKN